MAAVAQLVRALDCGSRGRGFKPLLSPISIYHSWENLFVKLWQAIILGVLQGLTEFFPVSSSGHLILGQSLLGLQNSQQFILFDLICHLGTLVALILFFHQEIYQTLFVDRAKLWQILVALLPLFPLLLILKPLKQAFNQPQYLFFFFALTALLLFLGTHYSRETEERLTRAQRWRDSLLIGLFQAMAILPGVSRSGSTLAAARLRGWKREESLAFSFLLAIPTILGGALLEGLQYFNSSQLYAGSGVTLEAYCAGFIASLIVGYAALSQLAKIVWRDGLQIFAWYCLGLSIFCSYWFN